MIAGYNDLRKGCAKVVPRSPPEGSFSLATSPGLTAFSTVGLPDVGLGGGLSSFSGNDSREKNESSMVSLQCEYNVQNMGSFVATASSKLPVSG